MRWLLVLAVGCAGEPQYDLPLLESRLIAEGRLGDPLITRANGELILVAPSDTTVRVLAFADGTRACELPRGASDAWSVAESTDNALVMLGTGPGLDQPITLDLYDSACTPVIGRVPNARWLTHRYVYDRGRLRGVLVATIANELLYLDRDTNSIRVLSTKLSSLRPQPFEQVTSGSPRMWIAEAGELVAMDVDFNVLARHPGTEMATAGEALAFVANGLLAYVSAFGATPYVVGGTACRPMFTETWLTFLSPCLDGQLMRGIDAPALIARDVASWQEIDGWFFWQTRAGELFALPPNATPLVIGPDMRLAASLGDNRFLVSRGADLSLFSLDAGLRFLAAGVDRIVIGSDYIAVRRTDTRLTVFDRADLHVRYERGNVDVIGGLRRGSPYLPYIVDRYGDDPKVEVWSAAGDAYLLARGNVGRFVSWIDDPEHGLIFTNNGNIYFAPLPLPLPLPL